MDRDCVLETRHQVNCSMAAVNSGCMGLERAEGTSHIHSVAHGRGKWKNDHVTSHRLSHCFKRVRATSASRPPGLEHPIVWTNTKRFYKPCLSQNWTLYDGSHPCNTRATAMGQPLRTSPIHVTSSRLMGTAATGVQKCPWLIAMPTSHVVAIFLACWYLQKI